MAFSYFNGTILRFLMLNPRTVAGLFGCWVVFGSAFLSGGCQSVLGSTPIAERADMGVDAMVELSAKGPWGEVEYFTAVLVAPLDLLKMTQPTSYRTVWIFEQRTEESVERLIKELDLPSQMEAQLLDRTGWKVERRGVVLTVPREVVRELPTEPRRKVYDELAKYSVNRYHVEPELVFGKTVRDWLEDFHFSEPVLNFISAAVYRRGEFQVFADTPEALALCGSDAERLRLRSAFSRTPTLMAKLILNSGTAEELAKFWGTGPRRKSTMPLIESLMRVKGLNRIDILHLLPAHVRKILFTFPNPQETQSGYLPDCHWTSLNFFNSDPLESLCDPNQATAYVLEHFEVVDPPYHLGDVIFFTDKETGSAYHSCAYVADDIVFTKNGRSPLQPWILMKLGDVKSLYDLHFKTNMVVYRRKQE